MGAEKAAAVALVGLEDRAGRICRSAGSVESEAEPSGKADRRG